MIRIEEFVPDIIQDDEEKTIMFLDGAHSKNPWVIYFFPKILDKYPLIPNNRDSATWQIEEERRKLPLRERALINCHHWGSAYHNYVAEQRYGKKPKAKGYGTVEHVRTGTMDAYEYMMRLPWLLGIKPAHKLYDPENYNE